MACKACRARKIKCDRARPVCRNCKQRTSHCTYAGERRTKHWTGAGILRSPRPFMSVSVSDRPHETVIVQPPTGLTPASSLSAPPLSPSTAPAPAPAPTQDAPQDPAVSNFEFALPSETWEPPQEQTVAMDSITSSYCPPMDLDSTTAILPRMTHDTGHVLRTPPSSDTVQDERLLDKILDGHDAECLQDPNPALWMRGSDGDEYTGPSSGVAAVSDMGLNWLRRNVPDSDALCKAIQDIRTGVFKHLRHPNCMPRGLVLAPPTPFGLDGIARTDIDRYIDAYFSDVQILFPILNRQKFLAQLSTFGTSSERHSWMSLLNAVLASGCRAALSDETADAFKASACKSWEIFQNALSFETQIIHGTTDLMAVQAMAVMTVFAQGLACPQRLEWTLSSITSRLAHSLALNRHPAPEWNLAEDEKHERNRVFWVIYCLDKMIALRSGRPPVICDDDISCSFPQAVEIIQRERDKNIPAETAHKPPSFDLFLSLTRLARICGDVSRRLYSAAALRMPASRLLRTLDHLLQNLESWLQMMPAQLLPGKPVARIQDTGGLTRAQIIILHSSYYYVLCAAYRRFTPMFTQDDKSLEHCVDRRSHVTHIRAARCIALLTKHLDIESHTPAWLIFYYPFTALTTIFVHTVSNPPDELTQRDIALMETVVGFFGRLEYVTAGETAFTRTTEFVRLARRKVAECGKEASSDRNNTSPGESNTSNTTSHIASSMQNREGMEDEQVGTSEDSANGVAYNESTSSSRMVGTGFTPRIPSPKTGQSGDVQRSEPVVNTHGFGMGMMNQNQHIDKDLLSMLSLSPGDMHPSHWLGDWTSTS